MSFLKILRRYRYDPLDRLSSAESLEGTSTQRFYQSDRLVTEKEEHSHRTIIRHEAQPLAQQERMAGVTGTKLLATDQAHSLLRTVEQQVAYTAYGHHRTESGLSRLIGFNGECPDPVTGHYPLGQGTRAFNPMLMRFNSPDELSPFGKGGINAYAYCGGDPINFSDPSGAVRIPKLFERLKLQDSLKTIKPTSTTINKTKQPISSASKSTPEFQVPSDELKTFKKHINSNKMRSNSDGNMSFQHIELNTFEKVYDLNKKNPTFKTVATQEQFNKLNDIRYSLRITKNDLTRNQIQEEIRATFLEIKKTSVMNNHPKTVENIRNQP